VQLAAGVNALVATLLVKLTELIQLER